MNSPSGSMMSPIKTWSAAAVILIPPQFERQQYDVSNLSIKEMLQTLVKSSNRPYIDLRLYKEAMNPCKEQESCVIN